MKITKIAAFIPALALIFGLLALPASAITHGNCPTCGGSLTFYSWVDEGWESIAGVPCVNGYSHTDGKLRRKADFYCAKCRKKVRIYIYGTYCPTTEGIHSTKPEGEVA